MYAPLPPMCTWPHLGETHICISNMIFLSVSVQWVCYSNYILEISVCMCTYIGADVQCNDDAFV